MSAGDDPTTGELRALQADREEAEREKAVEADQPAEAHAAQRRADKAAYLQEKLDEQAETLGDEDVR